MRPVNHNNPDRFENFGPFPAAEPARRVFNTPVTLGFQPVQPQFLGRNMLVVGQSGSGKTNIVHTAVAAAVCSPDVAVMVIEPENGGSQVAPRWVFASPEHLLLARYANTGPAIDSTLAHLRAIIEDRHHRFQPSMIVHNSDLVPVGNGRDFCPTCAETHPPAIMLVVDAFDAFDGEAGLTQQATSDLAMVMAAGPAMGVSVVATANRAHVQHLPSWMIRRSAIVVGLKTREPEELHYLFRTRLLPQASGPGQGLVQVSGQPVAPFYPVYTRPDDISAAAGFGAMLRPELDVREADLGGEEFHRCWDAPEMQQLLKAARGR